MTDQEIFFAFKFDVPTDRTKAQWLGTIAAVAAKLNAGAEQRYAAAPDPSYEGGIVLAAHPGDAGYKGLRMHAHTRVRQEGTRCGHAGDQSLSAAALAAMADDAVLLPSLSRVEVFRRRDTAAEPWSRAEINAVRAVLAADGFVLAPRAVRRPARAAAAAKPPRRAEP
jgi:hypothetical protein